MAVKSSGGVACRRLEKQLGDGKQPSPCAILLLVWLAGRPHPEPCRIQCWEGGVTLVLLLDQCEVYCLAVGVCEGLAVHLCEKWEGVRCEHGGEQ